jgi:hypothetical protein
MSRQFQTELIFADIDFSVPKSPIKLKKINKDHEKYVKISHRKISPAKKRFPQNSPDESEKSGFIQFPRIRINLDNSISQPWV